MHRLTGARWSVSSLSPGALEAAHALVFGEVVSLSEQQLVDCAGAFDTFGCNGGLPSHAFEYVRYGCARGSPYPPALSSSQTQSHQYAVSFQVGAGPSHADTPAPMSCQKACAEVVCSAYSGHQGSAASRSRGLTNTID